MRRGSFFVSAKLAPGVHDGDNGLLARNLRVGRKGAVDGGDEPLALSGNDGLRLRGRAELAVGDDGADFRILARRHIDDLPSSRTSAGSSAVFRIIFMFSSSVFLYFLFLAGIP